MWVAQGSNFVAGDILGGTNGILKFTENTLLAGGGSFTVSVGSGDITAMKFVAAPGNALWGGGVLGGRMEEAGSVDGPAGLGCLDRVAVPLQRWGLGNNGSSSL